MARLVHRDLRRAVKVAKIAGLAPEGSFLIAPGYLCNQPQSQSADPGSLPEAEDLNAAAVVGQVDPAIPNRRRHELVVDVGHTPTLRIP